LHPRASTRHSNRLVRADLLARDLKRSSDGPTHDSNTPLHHLQSAIGGRTPPTRCCWSVSYGEPAPGSTGKRASAFDAEHDPRSKPYPRETQDASKPQSGTRRVLQGLLS